MILRHRTFLAVLNLKASCRFNDLQLCRLRKGFLIMDEEKFFRDYLNKISWRTKLAVRIKMFFEQLIKKLSRQQ